MNKRIDYLFVDIEWEQHNNTSSSDDLILEIGAARLESNKIHLDFIKNYEKINQDILKFLKISNSQIKNGIDLSVAVKRLADYGANASLIIVWSEETRNKLILLAYRFGVPKLTENIVVLQNLIWEHSDRIKRPSFERALLLHGITFDEKLLHNAGIDAQCLKNLFLKYITKVENRNQVLKTGLIKLNKSDIYHSHECSCVRNKWNDDMKKSYLELFSFRPCEKCIGKLEIYKLRPNKKTNYGSRTEADISFDSIVNLAEFYNMSAKIGLGYVMLNTGYSAWKIYISQDRISALYHENYNGPQTRGNHRHRTYPKDIEELIKYIWIHDNVYPHKDTSADEILHKEKVLKKQKKMHKERKIRRRIERDEWEQYYNVQ